MKQIKTNAKVRIINYIRRTWKNKICAIALILGGIVPMILENDGTALVMMLMFAIPLFFSKKNLVEW